MKNKGFTLFIAVVIAGTLLFVATGIVNLSVKQAFISASARESQYAFYAADSAMECAIYWDVKNPTGFSAFATSTGSVISCNEDAENPSNPEPSAVGGSSVSQFTMTFLPDPYCATVTVTKEPDGDTKIESKGYNTCDESNPRRVERAVRVTY